MAGMQAVSVFEFLKTVGMTCCMSLGQTSPITELPKHYIFAVRFGQSNPCLVADPSHAHFHLGRYLLAMREFYALHDMQQPQLGVSWKNLTVTATM